MTLSRRKTLALIGGGTLFAATGAFAYDVTRPADAALAPWRTAGTYNDPRLKAFSWAILAPNPHNQQPWLLELRGDAQAVLTVNPAKLLPHTDPFSRQITIGLGCFLELARMAALADGFDMQIDLFPEGSDAAALDGRPVAVCTFVAAEAQRDPLLDHVHDRRSLKEPYDTTRRVPNSAIGVMQASASAGSTFGSTLDDGDIELFRAFTTEALLVEIETPRTFKESVDVFRIGRDEVNANPDGIDFTGPLFETLSRFGMFTRQAALDTSSAAYTQGITAVTDNTETAMGYIWLKTAGNTRQEQIMAGADWIRVNLAATGIGLAMQPLSQALQEYPEMAAHYTELHDRLAPEGSTLQMFARIGYGPQTAQSPRWPIDAKVVHA